MSYSAHVKMKFPDGSRGKEIFTARKAPAGVFLKYIASYIEEKGWLESVDRNMKSGKLRIIIDVFKYSYDEEVQKQAEGK